MSKGMARSSWLACSSLWCFLFVGIVSVSPIPSPVGNSSSAWDFFLFVQQSPGGFCYHKDGNCSYFQNVSNWTIHGLWASRNSTDGPNWCDKSAKCVIEDIEDLLPQMKRQWPSMLAHINFSSFWCHEWLKHGTCASEIECMRSEKGFFSTVLGLHQTKIDFSAMLSSQGIFPSHTHNFTTEDFNAAFRNTLGVLPLLQCSYSKETGQILTQVSVCLKKDFSAMSCPDYIFKNSSRTCWNDNTFRYIPNF